MVYVFYYYATRHEGMQDSGVKANSHMPCRSPAIHAVPLPFSDSAVTFVKVRVVVGNTRTASPTV
jgi:hypothetical protein